MMKEKVSRSFETLKNYCEREKFKGWDPYDGLNSKIFKKFPGTNNRLIRLIWIQLIKRSPLNLRIPLLVPKDYNPKGLGLFLSGYCNLYRSGENPDHLEKVKLLTAKILKLESTGYSGSCWGYNFDWQARAFFQPKSTPTVVATAFIAYALLDAFDLTKDESLLETARSSCNFVLNDLNRTYDDEGDFAFSYSPMDRTQVFNASLLGSRLLSRVYSYTGEKTLIQEAKKSVKFCVKHQKESGAWSYGTLPYHQWIDNFHTGFNLECLSEYQEYSGDESFRHNIDIGFQYYIHNFFTSEGKSKYYNNRIYPIDAHAPAQFVVTLFRLGQLENRSVLLDKVLNWTIDHMQNKNGYFYYQKRKILSSKIPYIRWAQAWMFYALSFYLYHESNEK